MKKLLNIGITAAIALLLSACAVDAPESDDAESIRDGEDAADVGEAAVDEGEATGSAEQALVGWGMTSEEYAALQCDPGSLINNFYCAGGYCDNLNAYCQPSGQSTYGSITSTGFFSEEWTNYRFCPAGSWVTGMQCSGSYCDNVNLFCSKMTRTTTANCRWTGWVSDETYGTLWFGTSTYMQGAECQGSNCDNMRFYVCDAAPGCNGACGGASNGCYCDQLCHYYGDCCSDKVAVCGS